MRFRIRIASLALLTLLSTCFAQSQDGDNTLKRLPTGVTLDPVGTVIALGTMPLAMSLTPGGDKLVVSLGGWREQGVQVINLKTSQVDQTLKQDAAFLGLAFSRDGHTLYASGGNDDSIYCYDWDGNRAQLRSRIELAKKDPNQFGSRYPAGLAISNDGKFLYLRMGWKQRFCISISAGWPAILLGQDWRWPASLGATAQFFWLQIVCHSRQY
jgi:DNA-binding beta-propeller fold protein YncE